MGNLLETLKTSFESRSNPDVAAGMKSYMKGKFSFYGIKSPLRKDVIKSAWKLYKLDSWHQLSEFVLQCWALPEREWQYTALDVMGRCKRLFNEETLPFSENLVLSKSWWDTVDGISTNVIGDTLLKYPALRYQYINRWMESGNIWLQRTCLIFQLKYREKTDFELMSTLILDLKDSREFFIQKGAGWALRQYSKFRPDLVKAFLDDHPDLPGLTRREGSKYC